MAPQRIAGDGQSNGRATRPTRFRRPIVDRQLRLGQTVASVARRTAELNQVESDRLADGGAGVAAERHAVRGEHDSARLPRRRGSRFANVAGAGEGLAISTMIGWGPRIERQESSQ